jgi:hypothetical protein
MTRRGLVLYPPFEPVVYPAFEQSFFVDPTVLLLFRAAAHSRRLHSALDRRTRPVRSASRALASRHGTRGMSSLDSAQGDLAMVEGQPWT